MTKDKSTAIALLGIGAVAIYALTRQQKTDIMGVFPDAWSGGGSATPPKQDPTPTPIIQIPEIPPPHIEQQPPEWLFYPPLPSPDYTGSTVTHKKETVPPRTSSATYTTGDPIHENIGPTGGFGGGGAGGRGGPQSSGGIVDVLKSLFSPLNLFASATPFGIVAAAPRAGLAIASAVTKKDEKVAAEKSAFESATDSAAKVASGGGGGGTPGTPAAKKTISAPSEDRADFFTSGKSYGSATVVGHSSGGTVYQHSGGARSVVSGGQIVAGSSRALDAADVARLPKKMRKVLGY